MTITQVFFRIWKAASLPLLVATLLICYFNLPDQVAIHFSDKGQPNGFINKQELFYWAVATIMLVNLLMSAFGRSLTKLLQKAIPKNLVWSQSPIQTLKVSEGWTNGLTAILNTFLILCLVALNKVNGEENQLLTFNFNWILIVTAILFMLILFYLPYKILYTKPTEEA